MASNMPTDTVDTAFIRYTAAQLSSSLLRQIALAGGHSSADMQRWRMDISKAHFHDASTGEIAFNDVQAIQMFNAISGEGIPIPDTATEGYNKHYHTSEFDGGFLGFGGVGPHDHRDLTSGGFAFAVYHPGTALAQQAWAL